MNTTDRHMQEIIVDPSITHYSPVFTDFNSWFSELIDEIKPDIIVAIARGAIRLIELHEKESLLSGIPLLSDHALPFLHESDMKNKTILLFDDSVIYGSTLSRIRQYLRSRETNVFCASYVVDRLSFLGEKFKDIELISIPSEHRNISLISKHKLWPKEIVKHHDQIVKTLNARPNNYNLDFPTFIMKFPKFSFQDIPFLEHYIKSTNLFRRISDVSSPSSISSGIYRYSCLFKKDPLGLFKRAGFVDIKDNSKVRLTFIPYLSEIRLTPIIQLNIKDDQLNTGFRFTNKELNDLFNYLQKPYDYSDPIFKSSLFRLTTAFVSTVVGEFLIKRISYSLEKEFKIKSIYLNKSGLNYIIGEKNFNLLIKILHRLSSLGYWNNISKQYSLKDSITIFTNKDQSYIDNNLLRKIVNYWQNNYYFKPNISDLPYEILGKIFLSLRNITDSPECRLKNPRASRIDIGFTHEELELLVQNHLNIDLAFNDITLALDICVDNGQAVPKVILKGDSWRRVFYSGENEDAQYTFQFKNALLNAYTDYVGNQKAQQLTTFDFHKLCIVLKDIFPDLPISTRYYTYGRFVNFVGKSDTDIIAWLTKGDNSPFIKHKKDNKTVLLPNNDYRSQITSSWQPQKSRDFFDAFQFIGHAFSKLPNNAKLLISTCRSHRHTYNAVAYEAHSWVSHTTNNDFHNLLSGIISDSNGKINLQEYALNSLHWCTVYIAEALKKHSIFHNDYRSLLKKLEAEFIEQGAPAKRFYRYFMKERQGFFDYTFDNEINLRFSWLMPIIAQMTLLTKFVAIFIVEYNSKLISKIQENFKNHNALNIFKRLYSDDLQNIVRNYNNYFKDKKSPGKSIIKTKLPLSITTNKNKPNHESFYKTYNILQNCYREISHALSIYCPEYKIAENDFPYSPDNLRRIKTDGSIERDINNTCIFTMDIIGSTNAKESNEYKDFILSTFNKFKRTGFFHEETGDDSFIACYDDPAYLLDIARALLAEEERLKKRKGKIRGTRKGLHFGNVTVIEKPNRSIILRDQTAPQPHSIPRAFYILEGVDKYCEKVKCPRNSVFIMDSVSAKNYIDQLKLEISKENSQYVKSKHYTGPCYIFSLS